MACLAMELGEMRFVALCLIVSLTGCSSNVGQSLGIAALQSPCLKKPVPSVGMTGDQVRASCWGAPKGIMEYDTVQGKMAIWAYPRGTVYMSNGKVTKIEAAK